MIGLLLDHLSKIIKIALSVKLVCVCVCVCVRACVRACVRVCVLLVTSSVVWCGIDPI